MSTSSRRQAEPVIARGVQVFLVTSARDRALRISGLLRGERRLGTVVHQDALGDLDVVVIDVSDLAVHHPYRHTLLARSPSLLRFLRSVHASGHQVFRSDAGLRRGTVRLVPGPVDE